MTRKAHKERKEKSNKATVAAGDTAEVLVEGKVQGNDEPVVRSVRDVAIKKAKEGEDVELDAGSQFRGIEHFVVDPRYVRQGRLIDQNGNVWSITGRVEGRETVLSRSAILKDGGDPGLLDMPHDDKFVVEGAVGNAQFSPSGVIDTETGEVREKTDEELIGGPVEGDVEVKSSKSRAGSKSPKPEAPKATPLESGKGRKAMGEKGDKAGKKDKE